MFVVKSCPRNFTAVISGRISYPEIGRRVLGAEAIGGTVQVGQSSEF